MARWYVDQHPSTGTLVTLAKFSPCLFNDLWDGEHIWKENCSMAEPVRVCLPVSSAPHQGPDRAVSIEHPVSPCGFSLAAPTWFQDLLDLPWITLNGCQTDSRQVAAPHLEDVRRLLSEAGFSRKILERIAAPQAPSTMSIYDGKWGIFSA